MASFNERRKVREAEMNPTLNHEGKVVHKLDSLETLFSKVLGSFFGEPTHYEDRELGEEMYNLAKLITEVDLEDIEYVLKIAEIGRTFGMISYPVNVLTACFNDERFKGNVFCDEEGKSLMPKYSDKIIRRAKDILDIMAIQTTVYGFDKKPIGKRDLPLPMQLRKCLKAKLESFNEYQLSKALGKNNTVSMADCIKLLRPNEKKANVREGFFQEVIEGKVKFADGVKQVSSSLANSGNSNSVHSAEDIVESLESSSLLSILKNLVALNNRGLLDNEEVYLKICSKLSNKELVRNSKILPFRFYSAFAELEGGRTGFGHKQVLNALSEALDNSIENLPNLKGYNCILVDTSGSMMQPISKLGKTYAVDIALLLGAILYKKGVADLFTFATDCKAVVGITRSSTILDIVSKVRTNYYQGGCTNLNKALKRVEESCNVCGVEYDNLIVLTDNDCNGCFRDAWSENFGYGRTTVDAQADSMLSKKVIKNIYVNNLLGNDFSAFNCSDKRKSIIPGFSERILDMINLYSEINGSTDIRRVIDKLWVSLHENK